MLKLGDEFAGAGGSMQGAAAVPGVEGDWAANHNELAMDTHGRNFPQVDHIRDDVTKVDLERLRRVDIFWASPACPPWTDARGVKRDFDKSNQQVIPGFEGPEPDEQTMRARALMDQVPRYLAHWALVGRPVLAGVVENVIQCRRWDDWHRWLGAIRALGYETRVIAFNSMHARPVRTPCAPQSRDRLYVAYWLSKLGRRPDWRKWLSPRAYCPSCDEIVDALQVFKIPRNDMGRYGIRHGQYVYRCPHATCRNRIVEPEALPAYVAIDWGIPGTPIGERPRSAKRPEGLSPSTIERIRAGLERYAVPLVCPAGGSRRTEARPVGAPMSTRMTRESDGLAVPPLVVPMESRPGKTAAPADHPIRNQTARRETGLAWLPFEPFIVEQRGGSSDARSVREHLATVTASGNHHFLTTPNTAVNWGSVLVPYYGNGTARRVSEPIGALSTRDRYAIVEGSTRIDIDDVLFRMLEPHEIGAAMAFSPEYVVLGDKRDQVRQLGNAVTPPVAEVIVSALVEAITGEPLEPAA
jgi:DNA (cytosine-5)-methyltransferase 1